jgi:hypothetical protein
LADLQDKKGISSRQSRNVKRKMEKWKCGKKWAGGRSVLARMAAASASEAPLIIAAFANLERASAVQLCGYRRLLSSASFHNLTVEAWGSAADLAGCARGRPWSAGGSAYVKLCGVAARLLPVAKASPTKLVLLSDGFDVVYTQGAAAILRAYKEEALRRVGRFTRWGSGVVYSAEDHMHWKYRTRLMARGVGVPSRELVEGSYPPSPTRDRFLNSGACIGPAAELLRFLRSAMAAFALPPAVHDWPDDQVLLSAFLALQWRQARKVIPNLVSNGSFARQHAVCARAAGTGEGTPPQLRASVAGAGGDTREAAGAGCWLPRLDHEQRLFANASAVTLVPSSSTDRTLVPVHRTTGIRPILLHAPGHWCGRTTAENASTCVLVRLGQLGLQPRPATC